MALHPIFGVPWIQLILLQSHQQKASNRVIQHLLIAYSIALQFMISYRIFNSFLLNNGSAIPLFFVDDGTLIGPHALILSAIGFINAHGIRVVIV
jgi:hypothetical protein